MFGYKKNVQKLLKKNQIHTSEFGDPFDGVQDVQKPTVVTVFCSDSRVLQDHMWDNDQPGDIFTCSNIGNRVFQETETGSVVSGDVLYPVEHTGTDTILVVGHTGFGAVTASLRATREPMNEPPGISHCIQSLLPNMKENLKRLPEEPGDPEKINHLVKCNVDDQVESLVNSERVPGPVDVIGVVYDVQKVYGEERGLVHGINVNGTRSVDTLREQHPNRAERIRRLSSP